MASIQCDCGGTTHASQMPRRTTASFCKTFLGNNFNNLGYSTDSLTLKNH